MPSTNLRDYQAALRGEQEAGGDFDTATGSAAELDTLSGQLADDATGLDAVAQAMGRAVAEGRVAEIYVRPSDGINASEEDIAAAEAAAARFQAQLDGKTPDYDGPPADDATRPHEYDVDSTGEVRNWREYAPAREAERAAEDGESDDDVRFSGGMGEIRSGAVDDEISRLIPTDGAFMNDRHKAAPELANLAEKLIHEHGFFEDLVNCRIDYKWRRKGTNSKGKRAIGRLERVSGIWSAYVPYSFVVWLAADTARLARFGDRQVEAALFHQLAHIAKDAKGNWIRVGHDFEGFGSEVRHYGPWTEDLKIGSQAFTVAVQLGLDLDEGCDSEEDEDEDAFDPAHADLSDLPDGAISSTTEEAANEEPADDDGYPRESDVRCWRCNEPVVLRDAEHDREIAAAFGQAGDGDRVAIVCDACAAHDDDDGPEIQAGDGCRLCGAPITAEEVEDQRCYGCGAVICREHHGDPTGPHAPQAHDVMAGGV